MKAKAHKHYSRQWLNPKDSNDSGMVQCRVYGDLGIDPYIEASLSIWDCSRKISLHFDFSTTQEATQRAKKIDILVKELLNLKEQLGVCYNESVLGNGTGRSDNE